MNIAVQLLFECEQSFHGERPAKETYDGYTFSISYGSYCSSAISANAWYISFHIARITWELAIILVHSFFSAGEETTRS